MSPATPMSRPRLLAAFIVTTLAVVLIALYARGPFWRGFLGDVTIVLVLFSGAGLMVRREPRRLALWVLFFCCVVEGAQGLHLVDRLGIQAHWLRVAIGNHFDPLDLLAYTLGAALAALIGSHTLRRPDGTGQPEGPGITWPGKGQTPGCGETQSPEAS
ncbi:ribosomal maturation YjgA family protein [Aeromonas schubertii]